MANLEKLIADHAYWSDERKRLHAEFVMKLDSCTGMQRKKKDKPISWLGEDSGTLFGMDCFNYAFQEVKNYISEYDSITFEEVWEGCTSHTNGEFWVPCQSCKEALEIRLQKANAGRRLGAVRAAITRVGRELNKPLETKE